VRSLLINTTLLVAGTELLALPLGVLLALALAKTDLLGRSFAWLLTAIAIFVPLYMVAGAWDAGFGIQGWHTLTSNPRLASDPWLSGWRGAIWVHAMAAVPWITLIVAAGLRAVDAELEEDAQLVMPAHHVLWRVTLRATGGAIAVAAIWIAMVVTTEIAATDLFQIRTFAEEVYTQAALGAFDLSGTSDEGETPLASLESFGAGIGLAAVLVLAGLAVGRRYFIDAVHAPERRRWVWRLKRARWLATAGMWMTLLVVIGAPLGNLVHKAGVHVTASESGRVRSWSAAKAAQGVITAPWEFRDELVHSIALAAAAATAAVAVGVPLAWTMRRPTGTPWLRLVLLAALLAVPGPLLGIAVIRLLNRPVDSPLAFLATLYDSDFAPWLVQTARAIPLVTLILWSALASVPQAMLDSAATDGAGWWRRLFLIAVPLRWPAIVAAWLVGLAIAVGELAATVLVVPPGPTTISVRIFSLIHYGVDDRVAAICLAVVLGLAAIVALGVRCFPQTDPTREQDATE
jgi:iron(III) transport system permease protein